MKTVSYFHHNSLMVKGYRTHKEYVALNPQFYVSTSGIKMTWLTPQIMGGRGGTGDSVPSVQLLGGHVPLSHSDRCRWLNGYFCRMGLLRAGCPSCHPTISVKAVRKHKPLTLTSGVASSFFQSHCDFW